jgi:hypothetical protein
MGKTDARVMRSQRETGSSVAPSRMFVVRSASSQFAMTDILPPISTAFPRME